MRIVAISGLTLVGVLASARAEPLAMRSRTEAPREVARVAYVARAPEVAAPAPGSAPAPRPPAFLEAADVSATIAPHTPEIERCYHAQLPGAPRAGALDVLLEIGRDGRVRSLAAAGARLSPRGAVAAAACIRAIAAGVRFPARRNDTTVVIPFLFHKAEAAGAGPLPSCWSATGCPTPTDPT